MTTATRFVVVASYDADDAAEAALDALADAEIHAVLEEGALQVPAADAPRALEILRAREAAARVAAGEEALAEDEGDAACLACGARIPEYLDRCPACGVSYG